MYDRSAGMDAARTVLENAPVIEGTPCVDLGALVDAVIKVTNPEALIVPVYDAMLAQAARYRLEQDVEGGPPGATMSITAHPGAVALAAYRGGVTLFAGLTGADAAWHMSLALSSAAMESQRLRREEGQGDHGSE